MRIYFLILAAALTAALWAQAPRQPTTPDARPATTPTTPTQPRAPGGNTTQPTTPNTPTQPANSNNQNVQVSGFDGVPWGTNYKDMKERFRVMASNSTANDNVEIIADTPDREILIRRREIYYRYVFYKKPEAKPVESMPKPNAGREAVKPIANEAVQGDAKFFFVESIFPLLKEDELYKTLTAKYGQRTGSSVGDTWRGAYTWDKADGFLVQWVEPYQKQGYTRSLYYLSRKIRDEIKNDLQAWQFVREIKALDSLLK